MGSDCGTKQSVAHFAGKLQEKTKMLEVPHPMFKSKDLVLQYLIAHGKQDFFSKFPIFFSDPKPYFCEVCGSRYQVKAKLKIHIK